MFQIMLQDGREHVHAFMATMDGVRFCRVEQQRLGESMAGAY